MQISFPFGTRELDCNGVGRSVKRFFAECATSSGLRRGLSPTDTPSRGAGPRTRVPEPVWPDVAGFVLDTGLNLLTLDTLEGPDGPHFRGVRVACRSRCLPALWQGRGLPHRE